MNLTVEHIAEFLFGQYGIMAISIQQLSPVFRIKTEVGPLCLKVVSYSERKLHFICLAMSHLKQKGFAKSPELLITRQSKPFTTFHNKLCFLTDWVADTPCDFGQRDHLISATTTLAEFHHYAQGLQVPGHLHRRSFWNRWPGIWSHRIQELEEYQSRVEASPLNSTGKHKLLSVMKEQIRQARESLEILLRSQYTSVASQAKALKSFVHRDVAARNFVIDHYGTAKIIDFDYCRWDIRIADIARLLDRTLRNRRWNFDLAQQILNIYDEINPIHPDEYPIILALLYFPQKFWRYCHRQFQKTTPISIDEINHGLHELEYDFRGKNKFLQQFAKEFCYGFTNRCFPSVHFLAKQPSSNPFEFRLESKIGLDYNMQLYKQAYAFPS